MREYLAILQLAAQQSEVAVDGALSMCIAGNRVISAGLIEAMIDSGARRSRVAEVSIEPVDLELYDSLLEGVAL